MIGLMCFCCCLEILNRFEEGDAHAFGPTNNVVGFQDEYRKSEESRSIIKSTTVRYTHSTACLFKVLHCFWL